MIFLDKYKKINYEDKIFWDKEAKFWSQYGKIYHHLEVSTPYKKMLSEIKKNIELYHSTSWLDAGCGPGTMIDLILNSQKNVEKIIGIDFDGVMLDKAIKRLSHFHNVKIKYNDLSAPLSFPDNSFGGIVANLVLSYIIMYDKKFTGEEALRMVLKDMYRLLGVGGLFIWTTPVENVNFAKVFLASWRELLNPLTPQYLYYGPRILNYALKIQSNGKSGVYHFLPNQKIIDLMKDVGFINVNIKRTFAGQAYLISA